MTLAKAANIYWLGIKKLRGFLNDYVLLALYHGPPSPQRSRWAPGQTPDVRPSKD